MSLKWLSVGIAGVVLVAFALFSIAVVSEYESGVAELLEANYLLTLYTLDVAIAMDKWQPYGRLDEFRGFVALAKKSQGELGWREPQTENLEATRVAGLDAAILGSCASCCACHDGSLPRGKEGIWQKWPELSAPAGWTGRRLLHAYSAEGTDLPEPASRSRLHF